MNIYNFSDLLLCLCQHPFLSGSKTIETDKNGKLFITKGSKRWPDYLRDYLLQENRFDSADAMHNIVPRISG